LKAVKIAKTIPEIKTTTTAAKVLLVWSFLLFFCATDIQACDAGDFLYEEFGQRCSKLAELTVLLSTAYKMSLPEHAKYKQLLLNEWVSFYLDHGKSPPSGFTEIATNSWQATLKFTGQEISKLTNSKKANEHSVSAKIPLQLLAQPKLFSQTRSTIASWTELFSEQQSESIASETIWLAKNARTLLEISRLLADTAPYECKRIRKFLDNLNYDWQHVLKADETVARSIYKFASAELRERLEKELKYWRTLTFM
jgi:hypothetical protein